MRHLFVLDPLERINPAKDSTAALMQAAARASLEVWACTPADLIALGDEPLAMAAPVQPDPWVTTGARERLPLSTFKVIWMRKDPPVDEAYLYATHLLDVAERAGVCVLNRPSSLRSWNEKLGALRFSRWMAPTLVSGRVGELQAFAEEQGDIVLKPLGGRAGLGVIRVSSQAPGLGSPAGTRHGAGTSSRDGPAFSFCRIRRRQTHSPCGWRAIGGDQSPSCSG